MKANLPRFLLLVWFTGQAITAPAALSYTWPGTPTAIPDNNASGVAFNFSLSDAATSISDIAVTLNFSGGFNGDLYAYLSHGDGFAVLLNRAGRTSSSDFGCANPGFAVTLTGSAPTDIHNYQIPTPSYNGNGQLTGTWGADGRNIDPALALDTTGRDATLANFNNLNPNGDWTLYFRDASPGGISTLNGFSLDITAVPEPVNVALAIFGTVAGVVGVIRQPRWRAWPGASGRP